MVVMVVYAMLMGMLCFGCIVWLFGGDDNVVYCNGQVLVMGCIGVMMVVVMILCDTMVSKVMIMHNGMF